MFPSICTIRRILYGRHCKRSGGHRMLITLVPRSGKCSMSVPEYEQESIAWPSLYLHDQERVVCSSLCTIRRVLHARHCTRSGVSRMPCAAHDQESVVYPSLQLHDQECRMPVTVHEQESIVCPSLYTIRRVSYARY